MLHRDFIIQELDDYGKWKWSIKSLERDINNLTEYVNSVKPAADKLTLGNPLDDTADLLLDRALELEFKKENLKFIREKIAIIEDTLDKLEAKERVALERLIIARVKALPRDIAKELGVGTRSVQNLRNDAIDSYAKLRVGITTL